MSPGPQNAEVCTTVMNNAINMMELPNTDTCERGTYTPKPREVKVPTDDMCPILDTPKGGQPQIVEKAVAIKEVMNEYITEDVNAVQKFDEKEKKTGDTLRNVLNRTVDMAKQKVDTMDCTILPVETPDAKYVKPDGNEGANDDTDKLKVLVSMLQNGDMSAIKTNRETVEAKEQLIARQCADGHNAAEQVATELAGLTFDPLDHLDEEVAAAEQNTKQKLAEKETFEDMVEERQQEVIQRQLQNEKEMLDKIDAVKKLVAEIHEHSKEGKRLEEAFSEGREKARSERWGKEKELDELVKREGELKQENAERHARIVFRNKTAAAQGKVREHIVNVQRDIKGMEVAMQEEAKKLREQVAKSIDRCEARVREVQHDQEEYLNCQKASLTELEMFDQDDEDIKQDMAQVNGNIACCGEVLEAAKTRLDDLSRERDAL